MDGISLATRGIIGGEYITYQDRYVEGITINVELEQEIVITVEDPTVTINTEES